ncbi:MAG: hydrogenase small subunit [Phyllobacteriaceae bacterium]|nr:hydrogenase small subunit [Phyllobacteriaceae bacterium]
MAEYETLGERLANHGISRRAFVKYASWLGSTMALSPAMSRAMAEGLAKARRQSVIWLSFQECTGCTESITRSYGPTLEDLIFDFISLDYHHTLMAASGEALENARKQAMAENKGKYIVAVDGSIPLKDGGIYSTSAGESNLAMLQETVKDAFAVISIGTCAAYGGIPKANPNPTGAVSVADVIKDKPIINLPGCPPLPEAMSGSIAYLLAFGKVPELDHLGRPKAFFGDNIHDRCYRRPFYERGQFAHAFDDEGARAGWCLYELGCKGPVTYNACATTKWNNGVSFPIQTGHGCLGCSEPDFWDKGGFYVPLSGSIGPTAKLIGGAALAGAVAGLAAAAVARHRKSSLKKG